MHDEKTCVICGIDVSKKRRVKDKSGRYACMECATREGIDVHPGGHSSPGATSASGVDYFATTHQDFCPNCGTLLGKDSTKCVACKYDTAPPPDHPATEGAEPDTLGPIARRISEEVSQFIPGFYFGPRNQFVAWSVLFLGMYAVGSTNLHTMYAYIAAWTVFLLFTYVLTIRAALRDKRVVWAAVGIFGLAFLPLFPSMPLYGFWLNRRQWLKVLWLVAILALGGGSLLYFSMNPKDWEIVRTKLSALPVVGRYVK